MHNHPSGCARPSAADVMATIEMARLAQPRNLEIAEHLIVAAQGIFSMRERRML